MDLYNYTHHRDSSESGVLVYSACIALYTFDFLELKFYYVEQSALLFIWTIMILTDNYISGTNEVSSSMYLQYLNSVYMDWWTRPVNITTINHMVI